MLINTNLNIHYLKRLKVTWVIFSLTFDELDKFGYEILRNLSSCRTWGKIPVELLKKNSILNLD